MAEAQGYTHPSISLPAWEQAATDPGVLIADGHDIRVQVRAGHLVIIDGPPGQQRTRKIAKVPRTCSRLVILAGHGMITAEAVRWLSWAELPWCMTGTDGEVIADSGPTRNDAALIRAQCQAATSDAGVAIARRLIAAKLTGQADLLRDVLPDPAAEQFIRSQIPVVEAATTLDAIRGAEANSARAYWQSWAGRVAVPWTPADLVNVPAHWRVFAQRPSLLSEVNRHATDPVNAALNYAYRVLESQAVLACHAAGLHPGLGISHTDIQNRNSMALDLMEAARPACDRLILAMMAPDGLIPYRDGTPVYFDKRCVAEERDGRCRLVQPLTHSIASHAADLAAVLLPHALAAAKALTSNSVRLTGRRVPGQPKAHIGLPKNRLRAGATVADFITDQLWNQIAPLIPEWKGHGSRGGRPRSISDRDMAASMTARFIACVPWESVPVGRVILNERLREWQEAGAWDKIRSEVEAAGHLAGLVE